jgi:hypothetical protein
VVFLKLRLLNRDLAASRFLFRLLRLSNQDCQDLLKFVKIYQDIRHLWTGVADGIAWIPLVDLK